MEVADMAARFERAINDAVAAGGAQLDDYSRVEFARMARQAGYNVFGMVRDEDEHEQVVEGGCDEFRKLVDRIIAFAKRINMMPVLSEPVMRGGMSGVGPNPPFWD